MKNFLYNINLYAQITNLMYTKVVLKEMYEQGVLNDHYYLKDKDDNPLENPIYKKGNLILELPLPLDIKDVDIEQYGIDHTKVLFNTLIKVDLYGLVKIDKRVIINENFNNEDPTSDYGAMFFIVKPDTTRLRSSLIWISLFVALTINIVYFFI